MNIMSRVQYTDGITNKKFNQGLGIEDIEEKRSICYSRVYRANPDKWIKKMTNWSPMGRTKKKDSANHVETK